MEVKIILTEDGSHSLFVPKIKETYHSFHGALQESLHVFIENGLFYVFDHQAHKTKEILEIGFGTGLNALLTFSFAFLKVEKLNFTSLEPVPLDPAIISQLNYAHQLEKKLPDAYVDYRDLYMKIHSVPWEEKVKIFDNINLQKRKITVENFSDELEKFDLVYFDAFAPNKQPELWTLEIFEKVYRLMRKGGYLVSYCAQGQFKRNLKMAGFSVETLPGPPGKKEMVRAGKT